MTTDTNPPVSPKGEALPAERSVEALQGRIDHLQGRVEELEFRLKAAEQVLRRKPPASFGG